MTRRTITTSLLVLVLGVVTATTALAYDYPSTNEANRANGHPHVNLVGTGIGYVNLEFVNETNSLAFFEYRIDGQALTTGNAHPVVLGDFIYEGICVDGRATGAVCDGGPVVERFDADSKVEVRLALGGERDWDFDWVTFDVLPDATSRDDCRDGLWADYGFANQGQCIRFVQTGQDSR